MPTYPFVDYPSLAELAGASRIIHTPVITPSVNSTVPGGGPEPLVLGMLLGLHYQRDTDIVYSYSKIQTSYLSDALGRRGAGGLRLVRRAARGGVGRPGGLPRPRVEVRYQEVTPDGSLRFPTFKCFRNDR